ncbi:Cytochrome b5 [Hondaea fermentalgiana]|uniref:Cytochrome b5 n=1 Tax=Hondaea fermentalgiana TaxID=2315210 RepID=A0A2R5GPM1_9STRA|nr:Cytochrome b5 [Hondaea fermentalgiana]|eukprot:GBG32565.1 Cytochrome b5 [Hondaea fermentalgiana]
MSNTEDSKAAATSADPAAEPAKSAPADDGVKVFTRGEVAGHTNEENDLMIIIMGKVYKVDKYLEEHPGGPEIIADCAGQDATEEFLDTGHSAEAQETLKKYFVGNVEGGDTSSSSATTKSGSEGPSMTMMIAVLAILFAIFAAVKLQA